MNRNDAPAVRPPSQIEPVPGSGTNPMRRPVEVESGLTEFREAVSSFVTGVAVVTCMDKEARVHGITVNSFTPLSFDPPMILIALKPGKAHRVISRSGRFGISVLDQEQEQISLHFGGRPQEAVEPDFQFRQRIPTLRQCLGWFECELSERVQVRDRTLFIAGVTACGRMPGSPLTFFAGRYHKPDADRWPASVGGE